MTSPEPASGPASAPATAPPDAAGVEGSEGGERTGPPRPSVWRGLALLVVLAGAAAAALWGWSQWTSDADALDEARAVARAFGAAYLSFDGGSVEETGDRLLSMGTEDFVREFESARLPSVESLFSDNEVSTRAEVTDVFTTGIDDGRVRALVFVDVDARGPEGEQRLTDLSFVVELELVEGEWLVDAVAPVPSPEVVGGSEPTTSSPSPTASEPAPPATGEPAPPSTGG